MALLIGYSILVGALVCLACHFCERALLLMSRPTRMVWLAGTGMVLILTFASMFGIGPRLTSPNSGPAGSLLVSSNDVAPSVAPSLSPVAPAALSLSERLQQFDQVLIWLWFGLSTIIGVAIIGLFLRARQLVESAETASMSSVPVRVTADIGPALVGVFSYQIVVPRWCLSLPDQEQSLIVAHEREHALAFDPALICVGALAVLLVPWNVSLWYLMRRLRASIELDCDARVLAQTLDMHTYGTLLLRVGARSPSTPLFAAALGETASQLERRLRVMSTRGSRISRPLVAISAVATFLLLAAAARAPRPEAVFVASKLADEKPPASSTDGSRTSRSPHNIAYVTVTPIRGLSPIMVVASGEARIGKGTDTTKLKADTLYMNTPASFTADVTDGDVYVISLTRGSVDVAVEFINSPAKHATGQSSRVTIERGGIGVSTRLTSEEMAFQEEQNAVADSVNVLARRVEPDVFDRVRNPGSSVVGIVIDGRNRVVEHSSISVPDSTTGLSELVPRLFPTMKDPDNVPYRVMSVAEGTAGGRRVQVVALFLANPKYQPIHTQR